MDTAQLEYTNSIYETMCCDVEFVQSPNCDLSCRAPLDPFLESETATFLRWHRLTDVEISPCLAAHFGQSARRGVSLTNNDGPHFPSPVVQNPACDTDRHHVTTRPATLKFKISPNLRGHKTARAHTHTVILSQ